MEASALSAPAGLRRGSGTSPWLRLRSDEQLVGLFRSGSEDAFRVIHDRYRQRLYAYARQMLGGSSSDAEDVMQDVFLRAYRALRADERPVSLRAWLYRVAHNRCIDGLRRPTPPASDIFEMSRTPILDPPAEVERREDLQQLVADVRRLPGQQRSALLMREMNGMSYADLADALDTSVPAVKSLLVRARIGLVEAIEARDADCADIRRDLAASYDRGVRASGRARRHLRDCDGCTGYRTQLRGVRQGLAALAPAPVLPGIVAKLLGLGGATGSGAAAGGAASGTTAAVGGGAAALTAGKLAVIVGCAAAITGGAVEVEKVVAPGSRVSASPPRQVTSNAVVPAAPLVELRHRATPSGEARGRGTHAKTRAAIRRSSPLPADGRNRNGSGGALAPPEDPVPVVPGASPVPVPAEGDTLLSRLPSVIGLPGIGSVTSSGNPSSSGSAQQGSPSAGSGSASGTGDTSASAASTSGTTSPEGGSTSPSGSSSGSTSGGASAPPGGAGTS